MGGKGEMGGECFEQIPNKIEDNFVARVAVYQCECEGVRRESALSSRACVFWTGDSLSGVLTPGQGALLPRAHMHTRGARSVLQSE